MKKGAGINASPVPDYVENGGACAHRITKISRETGNSNGRVPAEQSGAATSQPLPLLPAPSYTVLHCVPPSSEVFHYHAETDPILRPCPPRPLRRSRGPPHRAHPRRAARRRAPGRARAGPGRGQRLSARPAPPAHAAARPARRDPPDPGRRAGPAHRRRRPRASTSAPPASGCSTTTTWSRSTSARCARACRAATTASCPSSRSGPLAGYPRVYEIAITLISHTEGRIDLDERRAASSTRSRRSRRSRIGELWAMPAMLRLGLIENVRRMALRTVQRLDEIEAADAAAAALATAGAARAAPRSRRRSTAFVVRPAAAHAGLRLPLPAAAPASRRRASAARLARAVDRRGGAERGGGHRARHPAARAHAGDDGEQHHQPARHRPDGLEDVRRAPERIEAVLREDPSGFYPRMTFATRDHYRHVGRADRQADAAQRGEPSRATAVELRAPGGQTRPDDQRARPRRLLPGRRRAGRARARRPAIAPTPGEAVHRWVRRHPNVSSSAAIVLGTLAALAAVLWLGGPMARADWLAGAAARA